ncbi:MAG: conjugal transfer protein TraE [Kocuria rhizophila]|jgi:conjugal transfer pilus assembly protein TraE|uniref:type IV conjugative transfer system protein TraE n=1 Tax=Sphingomonas hankookensis TaxID=563996 RepID=UPI000DB25E7E|nr:type IV conjugative transfer system protein TraE [uncultured Sphingomonas sp.]PZP33172.1 MAG: conjugal transfer protein TraE [Kocuria rhizophila]
MDFAYQHSHSQRVLRQRNLLGVVALVLAAAVAILLLVSATRDREVVLQPVLRSPLTVSSAGVSREYLEMVTRDTAILTLDRSPSNLDYWMNSVLDIVSPRAQGKIKADLLRIVNEQRGSSISQYFTLQSMKIDPAKLQSSVTGQLNTIVGQKIISSQVRTFQFDWEYTGMSLKLIGFGMVQPEKKGDRA